MEQKYQELSIGFLNGSKISYEKIGADDSAVFEKIKQKVLSQTMVSLGAVDENENWAMDVACEKGLSYIVIIDIKQGVTYTYLNPEFLAGLRRDALLGNSNIFVCDDMEQFEKNEEYAKGLEPVEINGHDCPMLHVCKEPDILYKIIVQFLKEGNVPADQNWLKA